MYQPLPILKKNSLIGITCPSSSVDLEKITQASQIFNNWGFKVILGKTVGQAFNYFSGTDEERLADLQQMLDHPKIAAIMMGRGGYGMSRIIDQLDFTAFLKHPKWVCGFSDITVLHSHIHAQFGISTLHSPMCGAFTAQNEQEDFIQAVKNIWLGNLEKHTFPTSNYNKEGKAKGEVIGGNLAILAHLTGSKSEIKTKGKILFIEDVGEHLYNLDRMLLTLKRANQLAELKGLLVGSFTDLEDTERPFGQTFEEIIMDKVKEYNYPVAFNFPCGHQTRNFPLVLGKKQELIVNQNSSSLLPI